MRHIYTLVSKIPLPLDRTLTSYGRATHHLTLGVEAFDPYITTQVNGHPYNSMPYGRRK